MNRREFLKKSLITSGVLTLAPSFIFSQTKTPRKIIIIGAGLAGLSAGYELSKYNHQITILEAQNRVGGRVLTLREPFAENLYVDAGASRIPQDHELTLKYIAEFNLPLAPFYPSSGGFVRLKNGKPQIVNWKKFADATEEVMTLEKPELWHKIRGGNDQLPKSFVEKLKDKIKLNSPVIKIVQKEKSVEVWFSENGKPESLTADFLICALPFTMLRKIEITPKFSAPKQTLIENLKYDSATRVFLQMRRRFWEDKNLNGFAFGADNTEIWNVSFQQSARRGILQTYLRGDVADKLTALPLKDRLDKTVNNLEMLFPGALENFEMGITKCWREDPFVEGAWAHLAGKELELAQKAENRIFFAGDHTTHKASWMQGALESGIRAANEIKRAVNVFI